MCHAGQDKKLPLVVVKGQGPSLLVRNGLQRLDINQITVHIRLQKIKEEYKHLFQETLGKLKGVRVDLEIKDEANPKFFKPQYLPLSKR